MIAKLLSALSIAALAAGAAYAQDAAAPAPKPAQAEAAHAEQGLDAAQVTTKDDAKEYGTMEFQLADVDSDGKVKQEEFIAYVTAQLEVEAQVENSMLAAGGSAEETAVAESGEVTADAYAQETAGAGDADSAESAVAAAEASAQTDGATETAEATAETAAPGAQAPEVSPEKIFAEISGGKETITKKAMIKARLANFDEADANDDATLDESEKAQFVNLVWGRTES